MPDPSFELHLIPADGGFLVRATGPGGQLPLRPFALPFALTALPRERAAAAQWVKLARIALRRTPSEEIAAAQAFGGALFGRLFDAEALAAFRAARSQLEPSACLRLCLRLPPELAALPWELLYDAHQDQFLTLAPDLALTRDFDLSLPPPPLALRGPLQVVVVLASPQDAPPLGLDNELARIRRALQAPVGRGQIVLDVLRGPGTLDQLRERLRRPLHVLHVVSHGDIDQESGEGVLRWEDGDGLTETVGAELLRQYLLRQRRETRLVVLNACQGATHAGDDPFSSLGAALLRSGVPAIVAMQFDMEEQAAQELTRVFYAEVAAGVPVDLALTVARQHLYGRFPMRLDWAVPVLFLRSAAGQLFAGLVEHPPPVPLEVPPLPDIPVPPVTPPPAALEPLWHRALSAALGRRWAEAVPLLEAVAAQDPAYRNVGARLAEARQQLGYQQFYDDIAALRDADDYEEVLAALNELAQQVPALRDDAGHRAWAEGRQRRERQYQAALAASERSDWTVAHNELQTLLGAFPDDAEARALGTAVEEELAAQRRAAEEQQQRRAAEEQQQRRAAEEQQRRVAEEQRARKKRTAQSAQPGTRRGISPINLGLVIAAVLVIGLYIESCFSAVRPAPTAVPSAEGGVLGSVDAALQAGRYADALALMDTELRAHPDNRDAATRVAGLIENPAVPLEQRLQAGDLAGTVGDPRPGVTALPPAMVPFAGGSFVIGESQAASKDNDEVNDQPLTLAAFDLARYPVTNAQYALFIADGGYHRDAPWWDEAGRTWLAQANPTQPAQWDDERFGQRHPNYPVVGITWYEAQAFCRWLTQHKTYNPEGYVYQLPSEAEWEYAARGTERRTYPWGNELPDGEQANFKETHNGTTPVGAFPQGTTPEEIFDLAGNVWEWTRSEYQPYPYNPNDGREDERAPEKKRFTIRGGSWYALPFSLRAATRDHSTPDYHYYALGLRLARHLPP